MGPRFEADRVLSTSPVSCQRHPSCGTLLALLPSHRRRFLDLRPLPPARRRFAECHSVLVAIRSWRRRTHGGATAGDRPFHGHGGRGVAALAGAMHMPWGAARGGGRPSGRPVLRVWRARGRAPLRRRRPPRCPWESRLPSAVLVLVAVRSWRRRTRDGVALAGAVHVPWWATRGGGRPSGRPGSAGLACARYASAVGNLFLVWQHRRVLGTARRVGIGAV